MSLYRQLLRANIHRASRRQSSFHSRFPVSAVASPQKRRDVLILSDVYPYPSASAAGVRTSYLIRRLCRDPFWGRVHYAASAASWDEDERAALENDDGGFDVTFHSILPNRSTDMQALLDLIGKEQLSLVIFDRFYAEEKFSFLIRQHCPDAVRVVDMQDQHSLRQGRQAVVMEHDRTNVNGIDRMRCVLEAMKYHPSSDDSLLLRELASLHRSDLSLVCSPIEYKLFKDVYRLPTSKLCQASSWVPPEHGQVPSCDNRHDFCFIGGCRHPPNVDAIQQLAGSIWPRIRALLPNVNLHVYGAFVPPQIQALHDPSDGFLVHGFVPTLQEALRDKRVMLAPLRFGAGIKGKIIDAWRLGLPVVTTPIGSEGMGDERREAWGGAITDNTDEFVNRAVHLYSQKESWEACIDRGHSILLDLYDERHWDSVAKALRSSVRWRDANRSNDFVGTMLWQQSSRSTEYFSRWIECKERKRHRSPYDPI